jgi:hypothetical protein
MQIPWQSSSDNLRLITQRELLQVNAQQLRWLCRLLELEMDAIASIGPTQAAALAGGVAMSSVQGNLMQPLLRRDLRRLDQALVVLGIFANELSKVFR